jgi:hypothetical protein
MANIAQKGLLPKIPTPPESIGVVISTADGNYPNILTYHFISNESDPINHRFIRQGQYCLSVSIEGLVIGVIEQIQINNQYFQDVQTVKNYNTAKVNLQQFVPSDQWECHIAVVNVLGLIPLVKTFSLDLDSHIFRKIDKVGFPVKPGNQVYNLEGTFLQNFLGFDEEGLNIGTLKNYPLDTKLNLHRLFNRHLAILAQS